MYSEEKKFIFRDSISGVGTYRICNGKGKGMKCVLSDIIPVNKKCSNNQVKGLIRATRVSTS